MYNQEINDYYDATEHREVRTDLTYAVSLVDTPKIAIDCGCGAGADIDYLITSGFKVYGFDIEEESISRCTQRFQNSKGVILSKADFVTYKYPAASLIVADASLFFCPSMEFDTVWNNVYECLYPNGIFCGSFLGPEDTMARSLPNKSRFWPNISVFDEKGVRDMFKLYKICRFTEHKSSGKSLHGETHNWHIYSVVAKKLDNSSRALV